FGIAHLQGSEITHSGAVLGTPDYMAPEQVRGLPVTAATDIFAAGAVLYELLTYEKPFTGETLHAVLFKVVTENPRPIRDINPSLPENLQRIVDTALNKEPGQRYPTADAMAADLSHARTSLTNLETVATLRFNKPLNLGLPPTGWWRKKSVQYGTGAGALALIVITWAALGGTRKKVEPPKATPADTTTRVAVVTPDSGKPGTRPDSTSAKPAATKRPPRPPRTAGTTTTPIGAVTGVKPSSATSADRVGIDREVLKLEKAISAGRTAEIKTVMPGLTKDASK